MIAWILKSRGYRRAKSWAEQYGSDPSRLKVLVEEASRKADRQPLGWLERLWIQLGAMIRLIRAYASGRYRNVSWQHLVTVIIAIVYFLDPFDLIPDFIVGVGYIDDASVVALALKTVKDVLDAFVAWEAEQANP